MATVAELKALATLDGRQFESEVNKLKGKTSDFAGSLNGIKNLVAGAFSVGAVVSFAKTMLSAADSLDNASSALGVGVENLQALRAAAQEAGVGIQRMDETLGKIVRVQAMAVNGNDQMRDAFQALGLSMEQIRGQSPDKVLEMIAKGLVSSGNSAQSTAALFTLVGESSAKTLGLLQQLGTDGLDATREKFRELGLVVDEFAVNKLDQAEEKVSRFFAMLKAESAEGFADFIDRAEYAGKYIGAWLEGTTPEAIEAYEKAQSAPEQPRQTPPPPPPPPPPPDPREIKEDKDREDGAAKLKSVWDKMMYDRMSDTRRLHYLNTELAKINLDDADTYAKKAVLLEKQYALQKQLEQVQESIRRKAKAEYLEQNRVALAQVNNETEFAKIAEESRLGAPSVDALKRIGGFIGGESDPMVPIAERQLAVQEQIVDLLQKQYDQLARVDPAQDVVFTE